MPLDDRELAYVTRRLAEAVAETAKRFRLQMSLLVGLVSVRHYETSHTLRLFVTHWLEIRTAEHRLVIKASDWERLAESLSQRYPKATVTR